MSKSTVQEIFVSARLGVLFVAMLSLCWIGYQRIELYVKNIIIHESTMKEIDHAWFDMSLCFGPKYSRETISVYLKANELRQQYPETWREILSRMDPEEIHVHDAAAIGSIEQYRDFFTHKFNWTVDSMYDIGNAVNIASLDVGWYKHTFLKNVTTFHADFNFLSFKYSWCYNYTYTNMFAGHESVDGVKKSRSLEDPYHRVGLRNYQYDWFFERNRISDYIDVFVYPKGQEFEYPLIDDFVPFRVDMIDWQRLRTFTKRISRQNCPPKFRCIDKKTLGVNQTYSYNNCMTWCLRRTVLNNVKCLISELDHYVYNFTNAMNTYRATKPEKRGKFRSSLYFNADSTWPWMSEYLYLQPCDSAKAFLESFDVFEKTFFPRGDKFAMNSSCEAECPRECTEYRVMIATEGTELHPASERRHGVTIFYSARLEEISEKWKYTFAQLLIDISGVMSFLLGLSLIAIHEWCFVLTRWLVQRRPSYDQAPPKLPYLSDDMRYDDYHEYDDYDDYYEGGHSSRWLYPGEDHDYHDDYDRDAYDERYDYYDDIDEHDYAGDEKVMNAAHSGMIYDHESPSPGSGPHAKQSHLAP